MGKRKLKNLVKKLSVVIGKTAGGSNAAGQTLHGVLDLLPIPNQPIGKLVEAVLARDWEEAKVYVGKIFTLRNGIALALTIAILLDVITYAQIVSFFDILSNILELFNSVGVEA